jgi:hypothetical protein
LRDVVKIEALIHRLQNPDGTNVGTQLVSIAAVADSEQVGFVLSHWPRTSMASFSTRTLTRRGSPSIVTSKP